MTVRAALVLAAIGVAGCAQASNVAGTTRACTAALDLDDRLENAEDEEPAVDDFITEARRSDNERLTAIAERAQRAVADDDPEALREALAEAKEVCEEEGAL